MEGLLPAQHKILGMNVNNIFLKGDSPGWAPFEDKRMADSYPSLPLCPGFLVDTYHLI